MIDTDMFIKFPATYPENSQRRKFGRIALIGNEIVGYFLIIYGHKIVGGSNL